MGNGRRSEDKNLYDGSEEEGVGGVKSPGLGSYIMTQQQGER